MGPDAMAVTHNSTSRMLSAMAIFIKVYIPWCGSLELSHSTSSGLLQSLLPTYRLSSFIGKTYSTVFCSPLLQSSPGALIIAGRWHQSSPIAASRQGEEMLMGRAGEGQAENR
jgi:hypothetical protein